MRLLLYFIKSFKVITLKIHQKKAIKVLILSAIQSVADVIGLATIVPVLMLAIDGDFLEKSAKLRSVYRFSGIDSEDAFFISLILLMLLFFVIKNIYAIWLQSYIKKNAATIVAHTTRLKYRHFIQKEYQEIVSKGTPDFINLVMNIPYHYATGMILPFVNLCSEFLIIILFSFFAFYNPLVFIILTIILAPAVYLINKGIKSKIVDLGIISGQLREDTLNELNLGLNGITEIKINRVAPYFIERFVKKQYAYAKNEMRSLTMQNVPFRVLEIVALIAVIILVVYGYFFSENPSEVRILGALFVISIFRLIPAINRIMVSLMHIKIYKYTADELLKSAEYNSTHSSPIEFNNEIALKNISYTYSGSDYPIVNNISLTIKKGEIMGITGNSGEGKSTLIKILLQLIKQNEGIITVDGLKVSEQNELTWQQLIGYVGQTPYILNGTIKENVALGEEDESDERAIIESLKQCGLEKYANKEGLEYAVGENGIKLSEGQKQRLAMARVVYKKSEILILDEATSALDETMETTIGKTLTNLAKNSISIIIIAHRKNILTFCDKVYVLKEGNLYEKPYE